MVPNEIFLLQSGAPSLRVEVARELVEDKGAGTLVLPFLMEILQDDGAGEETRDAALDLIEAVREELPPVLFGLANLYATASTLGKAERSRIRTILEPYRELVTGQALHLYLKDNDVRSLELLLWSGERGGEAFEQILDWHLTRQERFEELTQTLLDVHERTGCGGRFLEALAERAPTQEMGQQVVVQMGGIYRDRVHQYWEEESHDDEALVESIEVSFGWLQRVYLRNPDVPLGRKAKDFLGYDEDIAERMSDHPVVEIDRETAVRAFAGLGALDDLDRRDVLSDLALAPSSWEPVAFGALEGPSDGISAALADRLEENGLESVPVVIAVILGDLLSLREAARLLPLADLLSGRTSDVFDMLEATFAPKKVDFAQRKFGELLGEMLSQAQQKAQQEERRRVVPEVEAIERKRMMVEALDSYQRVREQRGLPPDRRVDEWLRPTDD